MVDSGGRPAIIDDYASADVVARSQASVLFRVSRLRDGDVALKVFQLGGTPQEQAFARTRMLRDWRIWSELAHPHVLPVSDFGERNGSLYVATPWVDGPSLRAVLDQRRTLALAHVRQLATQVASALDAAAAVQLIHLDVKPENILFASADHAVHAYVTDFGAGSLAAREVGTDEPHSFRGTFEYAAPEQLQEGLDRPPGDGVLTWLPPLRDAHRSGRRTPAARVMRRRRPSQTRRQRSAGSLRRRLRIGATSATRRARISRRPSVKRSHAAGSDSGSGSQSQGAGAPTVFAT